MRQGGGESKRGGGEKGARVAPQVERSEPRPSAGAPTMPLLATHLATPVPSPTPPAPDSPGARPPPLSASRPGTVGSAEGEGEAAEGCRGSPAFVAGSAPPRAASLWPLALGGAVGTRPMPRRLAGTRPAPRREERPRPRLTSRLRSAATGSGPGGRLAGDRRPIGSAARLALVVAPVDAGNSSLVNQ
jgi:hypothetical protein